MCILDLQHDWKIFSQYVTWCSDNTDDSNPPKDAPLLIERRCTICGTKELLHVERRKDKNAWA